MGREIGTGVQRVMKGPAATLFGIFSDTNRFDRISGVTPSTYTFELLDPKDPTSRTRIGHAQQGPIRLHFAEEGEYWCDTFLRGERQSISSGRSIARGVASASTQCRDSTSCAGAFIATSATSRSTSISTRMSTRRSR